MYITRLTCTSIWIELIPIMDFLYYAILAACINISILTFRSFMKKRAISVTEEIKILISLFCFIIL